MSKNENIRILSLKGFFFVSNLNMFFFISGNSGQFQIGVTTVQGTNLGNQGLAGTGFDLVYAQVGC